MKVTMQGKAWHALVMLRHCELIQKPDVEYYGYGRRMVWRNLSPGQKKHLVFEVQQTLEEVLQEGNSQDKQNEVRALRDFLKEYE